MSRDYNSKDISRRESENLIPLGVFRAKLRISNIRMCDCLRLFFFIIGSIIFNFLFRKNVIQKVFDTIYIKKLFKII